MSDQAPCPADVIGPAQLPAIIDVLKGIRILVEARRTDDNENTRLDLYQAVSEGRYDGREKDGLLPLLRGPTGKGRLDPRLPTKVRVALRDLYKKADALEPWCLTPEFDALILFLNETLAILEPSSGEALFRFERVGGTWHIRFGREPTLIDDDRLDGLVYVADLLLSPDKGVKAEDLSPVPVRSRPAKKTQAIDKAYDGDGGRRVSAERQRFENELSDAVELGNAELASELKQQLDHLNRFHGKDQAKGGKARRVASTPEEKAVGRVRKAIAAVRQKLRERGLADLADYLEQHIKQSRGDFTYRPGEPAISWVVKK
jgi:hypothetical protein